MISGDSSVFMFCWALPVHHVHAFCAHKISVACCFDVCKVPSCCLGILLLYLALGVCVEPLLRFDHVLYETCLVLHVVSSCHVASLI